MDTPLPDALRQSLFESWSEERAPAWLELDPAGRVRSSGGELDLYGLEALAPGDDPAESLAWLVGLLPLGGAPSALPLVRIDASRFAEVDLLPGAEGGWILVRDATRDGHLLQQSQQARNATRLARRAGGQDALAELAEGLDMLVMRRRTPDRFDVLGGVPSWAQKRVQHLVGVDPAELSPFLAAFMPDAEAFWKREEIGRIGSGEWTEDRPGGQDIALTASAVQLPSEGALLLIEPAGADFDEKRHLIQTAREHSLEHLRLKKEVQWREVLLHCIVHDLKGPLAGIAGNLHLITSGRLPEAEVRRLNDASLRQCRRQERMIHEILDVFRNDVRGLEGDAEDGVVLREMVLNACETFRSPFTSRGIRLEIDWPDASATPRVAGNEERFDRIVANLLENAMRHTPEGGSVVVRGRPSETGVRIEVENEGEVIAEELRPRLFERFSGGGGGTAGLGLYYCRITLSRWGGTIGHSPREGGGACFWIEIPFLTAP